MANKNEVNFYMLETERGTKYKGGFKNEIDISSVNSQVNTYFNIDIQQSAYFTMLIEGFEYNRFHAQVKAVGGGANTGRSDFYFDTDPKPIPVYEKYSNTYTYKTNDNREWVKNNIKFANGDNGAWQAFQHRETIHWLPIKSLQYSQGSIEALSLSTGTFSDLRLPFRKQSPTLTVEMYDHRSDFFEMKLREWHAESVLTEGFVPVLESIKKEVTIMGFSTNGDCNYITRCYCILIDDISTSRSYEENALKVISFKLLVVGY